MVFKPRPKQQEVLDYRQGMMGVAAVPGSGKTHTLSYLAAELVASGILSDDQEVLVVTLVNSAVDNFSQRVARFLSQRGLLPQIGYRVRTLHGLAHDIVRDRPSLVGLSDSFQILDERTTSAMLLEASTIWVRTHPDALEAFLQPGLRDQQVERIRRKNWPELVSDLASKLIRQAKDLQLTPQALRKALDEQSEPSTLLEMACWVYNEYQQTLSYRGAVDFDDLIWKALETLQSDAGYLARLQHRWPYILEDEAQDSSRLQEIILRTLSGGKENWIRVGDPNQAIFETFTTASPEYLRLFLREKGVQGRELPNSGRFTRSILRLANLLVGWTQESHPVTELRNSLTPPLIEPTPPGDPQPNPPDAEGDVRIIDIPYTPLEEVKLVAEELEEWIADHPQRTAAILVPRNMRGFDVTKELKTRGVPYLELLRSSRSTRETAGALTHLLRFLGNPLDSKRMAKAFEVWRREDRSNSERAGLVVAAAGLLVGCAHTETYLWPRSGEDWLESLSDSQTQGGVLDLLVEFRTVAQRWLSAKLLPIDQLVLTLGLDIFSEHVDLALTYKMAAVLGQYAAITPGSSLDDLSRELAVVARNERRFLGLGDEDTAFDPDAHPGEVIVATIHKAKGLEWDRVYLLSLNNYDFPSAQAIDDFIGEKWFVRDQLNLEAETQAQLKMLAAGESLDHYVPGKASQEARLDYASERLRLLYVGLTRARRELILTWNTGRRGDKVPAVAFTALANLWQEDTDHAAD
jgi:DNA helicase-2/ATP-dependent DNA helicase PcrA